MPEEKNRVLVWEGTSRSSSRRKGQKVHLSVLGIKSAVRHLVSHFKRIVSLPRGLLLLTARSMRWALIQQNNYVHINNFTFYL